MKTAASLLLALLLSSSVGAQLPFWENLKQDETTTLQLPWDGLNGVFQVTGTLGGAVVTLEWKLRGAEVFTVVEDVTSRGGAADCALTTPGEYCWFRAAPQVRLRPVVTGGDGTTDVNVYLSAGDHAFVRSYPDCVKTETGETCDWGPNEVAPAEMNQGDRYTDITDPVAYCWLEKGGVNFTKLAPNSVGACGF